MQTIKLDVSQKNNVQNIYVKQRDVGRTFVVEIFNNGVPEDVSENQFSVWYSGASGDGNYSTINGKSAFSVRENSVIVELIAQMLNVSGDHNLCLIMKNPDGNQIGLWNIPYYVEQIPGVDSKGAIQYHNILEEYVEASKENADRAEEAADSVQSPVSYAPQNLTYDQRIQARKNIGAAPTPLIVTLTKNNSGELVSSHTSLAIANAAQDGKLVCLIDEYVTTVGIIGIHTLIHTVDDRAYFANCSPSAGCNYYYEIDDEGNVTKTSTEYVTYLKQTLSEEQQAQARENIGAAAIADIPTDYVAYAPQALTPEQQEQVRENIGAAGAELADLIRSVAVEVVEHPEPEIQQNAIINNGAIITPAGAKHFIVATYQVKQGVKYEISGSTGYRNDKYAFFDENGVKIVSEATTSLGDYEPFTAEVVSPQNAVTLKVSGNTAVAGAVVSHTEWKLKPTPKKYDGKTWAVLGDSLTHINNRADTKYYDYIAEELGCEIVNYGMSGTGYKAREASGEAFYQRMLNIAPENFDVLTVFGSFNDIGQAEIGSSADTGTDTLCGCINTTLDNYYSVAPFKPIGIVTPCPWFNSNPKNSNSVQSQYVDALIEIARLRGIPCLDLFHSSGLRPWNAEFVAHFYTENGVTETNNATHPNSEAHRIYLYPQFREFLKKLL